jgi:predicted esterase
VVANYPIDTDKVVLTGFSMGGYGAYRTFRETPTKFRAVAVFSGGTHFGESDGPGGIRPDFRHPENLAVFRDVPVFIYHGEQDRNVSYESAVEVAGKLEAAGARVEFHSESDKGHEAPGRGVVARYHRWLDQVLESDS